MNSGQDSSNPEHQVSPRDHIVDFVETQLIGRTKPDPDEFPDVEYPPHKHYIMGVLYPHDEDRVEETRLDEVVEDRVVQAKKEDEHSASLSGVNRTNPSAMGISFYVQGHTPRISIRLECAVYDGDPDGSEGIKQPWSRRWISRYTDEPIDIDPREIATPPDRLEGLASLSSRAIPYQDGWIITLALANRMEPKKVQAKSKQGLYFQCPSRMLFQVGIRCSPLDGEFSGYPSDNPLTWDEEEEELDLQFREQRTWAVGHGVAAEWPSGQPKAPPPWVGTNFLPRKRVYDVTFDVDLPDPSILYWTTLADPQAEQNQIIDRLDAFVDAYEEWTSSQKEWIDSSETPTRKAAATRITDRQSNAVERMRDAVEELRCSKESFRAFQLANEAILIQRIRNRDEHAGKQKPCGQALHEDVDYFDIDLLGNARGWRPFQLAFFLLVIPSLVDPEREDHELVDLLWFPTGGGKTEAYLGLSAFEIFRRRIMDGSRGGGTCVIKRYTYRVLTFQQFERAATMIAACEFIRSREGDLEDEPITLGMWVGSDITPNNYNTESRFGRSLKELMNKLSEGASPFQIQKCPWCGTELVGKDGSNIGFEDGPASFRIFCPNSRCRFHNELPVKIIDECLYQNPPTMLIGTIDKFTQLAWKKEPGALLGTGPHRNPPSLLIQDELHLINGPLGTLAGLYESAINTICAHNHPNQWSPKVIGATATIRRANEQSKALYASNASVFPPAGVSADDSFFMRLDRSKPGRLYVGVMGQGHTPLTSLVHLSSALSMSANSEDLESSPTEKDGYWTQVIYLNSRRELSQTMTAAVDDIPKRMRLISYRDDLKDRIIHRDRVLEISGTTESEEIPAILTAIDHKYGSTEGPVDILGSTSILSVGVDKPRLGLMLMNGQPKTTSEYIQATSRVGRGETPGLIFTHYSAAKPRDRSHYETFTSYHDAIYRFVEPVSVTPWALPARDKGLPAAFIASVRHTIEGASGQHEATVACNFQNKKQLNVLRDEFIKRCSFCDPQEQEDLKEALDSIIDSWSRLSGDNLKYANRNIKKLDKAAKYLLRPNGTDPKFGEWVGPDSMRDVDLGSGIKA